MMKPHRISLLLRTAPCLILAGAVLSRPVVGEEYLGSETYSQEQLIDRLKLPAAEQTEDATGFATRSIVKRPKEKAISMEIKFDYNSAALTAEARQQLAPLRQALASEALREQTFIVEGHTDSKGAADYNQRLSERRAASVRQFLLTQSNLDSARIKAVGRGESMPLEPGHPEDSVNRRVTIITNR